VSIISIGVAFADPTIAPVDEKFGLLVLSDFSGAIDGFALSAKGAGRLRRTGSPDAPLIAVWHNMLTWLRHLTHLSISGE